MNLNTAKPLNLEKFISSLVQSNILNEQKAARLTNVLKTTGQSIDLLAVELGFIQEKELAMEMAKYFSVDFIDDAKSIKLNIDSTNISGEFLEYKTLLPMSNDGKTINMLISDPFDDETLEMCRYFYDLPISISISTRRTIADAHQAIKLKTENKDEPNHENGGFGTLEIDTERLKNIASDAPIVKLVNEIIQQASDVGATDIHIEPAEDVVRVRRRQDGILIEAQSVQKSLQAGLISRIKILAGLNISERRLPQDGRLRMPIRGIDVDFRVSVVPSIHGETIVLRLLERSSELLSLENLGFARAAQEKFEKILKVQNGIFLVTGPTGSGKTTTLYALLKKLRTGKSKIFTIEDPVEYRMDGITQLQINTDIGLDFPKVLKSVLRQDPDIILIGEIRDAETAKIATQAALTGHLVLSTLHTNSAIGAVTRLRDMGIDNFLISATLRGVVGQRLVRKLCTKCSRIGTECDVCNEQKYLGRTAIYEITDINEAMVTAINEGKSNNDLEKLDSRNGKIPISEFAKTLVDEGITSQDEVARVTHFDVG
ncbi:MAG: type II/IV secretion system protein [Rhodobacteraceae bacterium]|nr:type II/IV secretion system protein [Paracoccaceae bacterium]